MFACPVGPGLASVASVSAGQGYMCQTSWHTYCCWYMHPIPVITALTALAKDLTALPYVLYALQWWPQQETSGLTIFWGLLARSAWAL